MAARYGVSPLPHKHEIVLPSSSAMVPTPSPFPSHVLRPSMAPNHPLTPSRRRIRPRLLQHLLPYELHPHRPPLRATHHLHTPPHLLVHLALQRHRPPRHAAHLAHLPLVFTPVPLPLQEKVPRPRRLGPSPLPFRLCRHPTSRALDRGGVSAGEGDISGAVGRGETRAEECGGDVCGKQF